MRDDHRITERVSNLSQSIPPSESDSAPDDNDVDDIDVPAVPHVPLDDDMFRAELATVIPHLRKASHFATDKAIWCRRRC